MKPEHDTESNAMQATANSTLPPDAGVTVARSVLHGALTAAERAADELNDKIRECEQQRDDFVRRAGAMQKHLDHLHAQHANWTRLVRELLAATDHTERNQT